MPTFYFTFGYEHGNDDCIQPIIAPTYEQARQLMIRHYGNQWAFGNTQEEFDNSIFIKNLKQLPVIEFKEVV